MGDRVPEYVTRQRAAAELCMSDDTFDKYVREGVLPSPKRRGTLTRWKWSDIVAAIDGGSVSMMEVAEDSFEKGIRHAKEASGRAA
jgi:predicted DNA-binding transcriptional regulator AlpA